MIKTLRITSIIAVVITVVFFALPAASGVRGDRQREQFLNSVSVIEEFKESRGEKFENRQHEVSPLVKEAETFALYLNPPPKPKSETKRSVSRSKPRPRGTVSAKFKLVGTSFYALHPDLSLALIDEPGKGLRWVRQSDKLGHLIIEQVKDGLVIFRDGTRTFELVAERPKRRSLVKKTISSGSPEHSEMTAEEEAMLEKEEKANRKRVLADLDAFLLALEAKEAEEAGEEVDEADSEPNDKEIVGAGKKSISDLETMRISAREARKLGRLGRKLKNVKGEPDLAENSRIEGDVNLFEPNLHRSDLD